MKKAGGGAYVSETDCKYFRRNAPEVFVETWMLTLLRPGSQTALNAIKKKKKKSMINKMEEVLRMFWTD